MTSPDKALWRLRNISPQGTYVHHLGEEWQLQMNILPISAAAGLEPGTMVKPVTQRFLHF